MSTIHSIHPMSSSMIKKILPAYFSVNSLYSPTLQVKSTICNMICKGDVIKKKVKKNNNKKKVNCTHFGWMHFVIQYWEAQQTTKRVFTIKADCHIASQSMVVLLKYSYLFHTSTLSLFSLSQKLSTKTQDEATLLFTKLHFTWTKSQYMRNYTT